MTLYGSSDTLAAGTEEGIDVHPEITTTANATQQKVILERFMRHPFFEVAAIVLVALSCAACAPEIVRSTIPFVQKTDGSDVIQLTKSTTVPNYSGAGNTLFIGTRWQHVGDVAHGKVYRSRDTVFFLRGANTHEAYLVIRDKKLLGFYLPGDKAWSPLEPALDIDFIVN